MSAFLLYFETKNINSINYKGFPDVGKFTIPNEIYAGKMKLIFNNSIYEAAMISDRGGQSCNNFFIKNNETKIVREMLFEFIFLRLKNECVISNLSKFIFNDQSSVTLNDLRMEVNYQDLEKIFNRDIFDAGSYLSIER